MHDGPTRLYDRLLTPRVLQAEATFGATRVPSFSDLAVDFPAGVGDFNRLLSVPLLPGSSLATGEAYLVRIVVDQTVLTADHDPVFGITDGTTFIGLMKGDASNAELGWGVLGPYGANLAAPQQPSLGGPAGNLGSFELAIRLAPQLGATTDVFVVARGGAASGRYLFPAVSFDRAAPLTLAVFANNAPELYRFHGFDVTISRDR